MTLKEKQKPKQKQKIVLASHNQGKIKEISAYLNSPEINLYSQSEFSVPECAETGLSFVENALLKARHASRISGLPAIADDSGLVVYALGGKPGIYSARYAGEKASSKENNEKLLKELAGVKDRAAEFYCVMVYLRDANDPCPIIAEGCWKGEILESMDSDASNGFGYDPVFFDLNYQQSAAHLSLDQKNQVSHRGQAMKELRQKMGNIF